MTLFQVFCVVSSFLNTEYNARAYSSGPLVVPPAADAQANTLQKVHLNFIRIPLQQKIVLPGERIVQLIAVAVSLSLFYFSYLLLKHFTQTLQNFIRTLFRYFSQWVKSQQSFSETTVCKLSNRISDGGVLGSCPYQ